MLLLRGRLLFRRWCQSRTSLALIGHYATEKSPLTVAERRGRWLRRTTVLRRTAHMRLHWSAPSNLQLTPQHADFSLVLLLHLQLILLKLVDLVADQLHFLDLLSDLGFHLLRSSTLILELGPQGIEEFIETWIVRRRLARPKRLGAAVLPGGIEHLPGCSGNFKLVRTGVAETGKIKRCECRCQCRILNGASYSGPNMR